MAKYEPGEIVTLYLVIDDEMGTIRGWTENKQLAKFYIEFHNYPSFRIKKITKVIEEINCILDENLHDGISLTNIITRDKNKPEDIITVVIPATENEVRLIDEEASTFFSGRVNYGFIESAIPFLKNKYQKALKALYLPSIIMKTVHNRKDINTESIELDHLMILLESLRESFG